MIHLIIIILIKNYIIIINIYMTRSFLVIRNKRSERLHYWVASIFYVDSLGGLRSVYVLHQKFRYEVF